VTRTARGEPLDAPRGGSGTAILREQHEAKHRVVDEFERRTQRAVDKQEIAAAIDVAQRALNVTLPLVNQHGVVYAVGQEVKSLTELWCTGPRGQMILVAGTPGVISKLDERNAGVLFVGRTEPYFIRHNRMRVVLEVVK
jgi:hypothetical protein